MQLEAVQQYWESITFPPVTNAAENLIGFLRIDLANQAREFAFSAIFVAVSYAFRATPMCG